MGTISKTSVGLGTVLFSKTQRQILGLLFSDPDKSRFAKEIVRFAGVGVGSVLRELGKLTKTGLLTVEKIGNQKHYRANCDSPIFKELRGIVLKTFGLADLLRDALEIFHEEISVAFIFGSVAKGEDRAKSDIDILIVTETLTYSDVLLALSKVEERIGRILNPVIYSITELQTKLAADHSFVTRVMEQEKIFLIGTKNDIGSI